MLPGRLCGGQGSDVPSTAKGATAQEAYSREGAIGTRMRLGDLLIQAKLVTEAEVTQALDRAAAHGGRLGDNLVAGGAIDRRVLDGFLHRIPLEPVNMAATGIDETDLMSLLMKLIYTDRLETVRQFGQAIKLPFHIVIDLVRMATDRKLLQALGSGNSDSPIDLRYALSQEGRNYTLDALQQLRYAGPAPVTLEDFTQQVNLQKPTNELVTVESIEKAIGDLVFAYSIVEQSGPALNSGRALLLYGPPGNGKSSVARRFANVFKDVIYVPYAVMVDGQIIRVHDPSVHTVLDTADLGDQDGSTFVRHEEMDARWVPCRRPFVITGGELTLDMLDLRFDVQGHFYEAPLHVKALGGCFMIDDFGRQLVSPTDLLNRWIVPLENRVDYLKLHTGKTFTVPFEELVIFSTNLEPEDLMDPAFLRRLPYKIEIGPPTVDLYRRIFDQESQRLGLTLPDAIFDAIVRKIQEEKGMSLAAYQPKFIVDQVVATCRFMGKAPHFEPRFIEYAIDNLKVNRSDGPKAQTQAKMAAGR